jgi:hypothetical protein
MVWGCMTAPELETMSNHFDTGRMAVLAELNTTLHLLALVMSVHGGRFS